MPTVILLDSSLSLLKPITTTEGKELTVKDLAILGINEFLDQLSEDVCSRWEFISLMTFSSSCEKNCNFTRDYNQIKNELKDLEDFDKTCIEQALHAANESILSEWGNNTFSQIILIGDGGTGCGRGSLKESLATLNQRTPNNPFPIPFPFPGKLHVVCLTNNDDPCLVKYKPMFQKLVDMTGYDGSITVPEMLNSEQSVRKMFRKLAEDMYKNYKGTLKCGHLASKIVLSPDPLPFTKQTDFEIKTYRVSDTIEVVGFISINDVGSPMAVSRHLILPFVTSEMETEEEGTTEFDKVPSFCVLLHGALKVENMTALVTVADNWFGFIYSWADSKKKSNLMLTLLTPGATSVPWLGNLNNLCAVEANHPAQMGGFPVWPAEKRSYSLNSVVWIRQAGLQSDIQKILRHARKLPEKLQQFYKELNRVRKAAIAIGFLDLLNGLAVILEHEMRQMRGTLHPDSEMQLQHAVDVLKSSQCKDVKYIIRPRQSFNS